MAILMKKKVLRFQLINIIWWLHTSPFAQRCLFINIESGVASLDGSGSIVVMNEFVWWHE